MSKVSELIVDAYGCTVDLSDVVLIESHSRHAIESVGAQIVGAAHHRFQPHGLTLLFILKESHFVISTWPEFQMAVVNIFLCNEKMDPQLVWTSLAKTLKPSEVIFHQVDHELAAKNFLKQKRA